MDVDAPIPVLHICPPEVESDPPYRWVLTSPDGEEGESISEDLVFMPIVDGKWLIAFYENEEDEKPTMTGSVVYPNDFENIVGWADDEDLIEFDRETETVH